MIILGLNAYHGDSSAALYIDGKLVAAAEEERFRRIKHWSGMPSEAIAWCLHDAGIKLKDIHHVAINRDPKIHRLERLQFILKHRPSPKLILKRLLNIRRAKSFAEDLASHFPKDTLNAQIHHVEHHLAHLASAFLTSDFKEAACLSVDGFGDFSSSASGIGTDNHIHIDHRVLFPHSLGIFYSAVTQFLGFHHFGDEYKVMGLAPYGEPRYAPALRQLVTPTDAGFELNLKYFRHHNQDVHYTWNNCSPEIGILYRENPLLALLGNPRHKDQHLEQHHRDIARSAQVVYEEIFFHLLRQLHQRHPLDQLALSGGCAMNSVANGKVYLNSPFKKMYLPAAAGDAGGAIGAAAWVSQSLGEPRHPLRHAYHGYQSSPQEITQLLHQHQDQLPPSQFEITHTTSLQALCTQVATAISQGKVIGWFQDRMEWGPRALGNRSILGDPRRPDMKDILNLKIKRRESFRPFAPSILREHVNKWFEQDDDVPFMMQVFQVRPEKRSLIPATTHNDGSGRLQTVHQDTNPRYHQLISTFRDLTGVPILLNTSFNENEPVVCKPKEALHCFLRTQMDVLVLNDCIIQRQESPPTQA